jgi:hypothetical protein
MTWKEGAFLAGFLCDRISHLQLRETSIGLRRMSYPQGKTPVPRCAEHPSLRTPPAKTRCRRPRQTGLGTVGRLCDRMGVVPSEGDCELCDKSLSHNAPTRRRRVVSAALSGLGWMGGLPGPRGVAPAALRPRTGLSASFRGLRWDTWAPASSLEGAVEFLSSSRGNVTFPASGAAPDASGSSPDASTALPDASGRPPNAETGPVSPSGSSPDASGWPPDASTTLPYGSGRPPNAETGPVSPSGSSPDASGEPPLMTITGCSALE